MLSFVVLYSNYVLERALGPDDFRVWCMFSSSCRFFCSYVVNELDIVHYEQLYASFVTSFKALHTAHHLPINFHFCTHIGQTIRNFGPCPASWW